MFALHRDQFNVGFVFSSVFSMMMSKYFHDYARADRRCLEALAQIACKNHHHAINNDYAHLREEITVQDVLESPSLGNPLKRLHCSPISDGAAAVILVGPRLAKKLTDTPIYVVGSQQATCDDPLESRKSTTGMEATRLTISKALKDVKLCIEDIQIAEIHDCFTIEEAMFLEDSGFYGTGKAWQGIYESYESFKGSKHIPYVKDGGMLVVNPSGGLKADGHPIGATGLRQVYECFKQLRQEANKNQVDVDGDLNLAVCHDIGGTGGLATTHILARSIP
jgi:acetyl-CoA C-acetyltransferase